MLFFLSVLSAERKKESSLCTTNVDFLKFCQEFHAGVLLSSFDHSYFEHLNLFRISGFEFGCGFAALWSPRLERA